MYGDDFDKIRCLACATVYETTYMGGHADPCPRRYLTPHTDEFKRLVAEVLVEAGLGSSESWGTREQHQAAVKTAKERWDERAA